MILLFTALASLALQSATLAPLPPPAPAVTAMASNRLWRQLLIDGIKADPVWAGGNYKSQPVQGLRTAASMLIVAGAAPLNLQHTWARFWKADLAELLARTEGGVAR